MNLRVRLISPRPSSLFSDRATVLLDQPVSRTIVSKDGKHSRLILFARFANTKSTDLDTGSKSSNWSPTAQSMALFAISDSHLSVQGNYSSVHRSQTILVNKSHHSRKATH